MALTAHFASQGADDGGCQECAVLGDDNMRCVALRCAALCVPFGALPLLELCPCLRTWRGSPLQPCTACAHTPHQPTFRAIFPSARLLCGFARLRAEVDEARRSTREAMGRATKAEAKVRTLNAKSARVQEESKRLSSELAAEVARRANDGAEFNTRLLALERINAKLIAQGRAFWDECDATRATLIARANAHVDAADGRRARAASSAASGASTSESTRSRLKLQRRTPKGLRAKIYTVQTHSPGEDGSAAARGGVAGGGSGGSAPRSEPELGESAADWSMRVRRQHGGALDSQDPVDAALVGLEFGNCEVECLHRGLGGSAFAPTVDAADSCAGSQAAAYPGESQFVGALDAASELDAIVFQERFGSPARRARQHRDVLAGADEAEAKHRAWDREALGRAQESRGAAAAAADAARKRALVAPSDAAAEEEETQAALAYVEEADHAEEAEHGSTGSVVGSLIEADGTDLIFEAALAKVSAQIDGARSVSVSAAVAAALAAKSRSAAAGTESAEEDSEYEGQVSFCYVPLHVTRIMLTV